MRFRNRRVYIHTDLKWSSQYQNGLEMPQLTADWPGHTLRGPKGTKVAKTGLLSHLPPPPGAKITHPIPLLSMSHCWCTASPPSNHPLSRSPILLSPGSMDITHSFSIMDTVPLNTWIKIKFCPCLESSQR